MTISKILKIIGTIALICISVLVYILYINPASPRGFSEFSKDELRMSVDYSRPYKKDRLIFGDSTNGALVTFNKYWRLGANFATTFETNKKISFAGRILDKGKYRMYAVPYKNTWKISLNSEPGSFGYSEPDYSKDIMSVNLPSTQMTDILEQLTIDFIEDNLGIAIRIRWDSTMVVIPLK
ncbi:MAG: hypothetical protein CMC81_07580 [Flavobacteriaceae bacterium]|nr:hypothetical protein [Flavobacteriaceae bacterium]|tara:strand:+ start:1292 stop:1834 length:543 start_codon:yes stop_codon:yes gene_type:complete